MADVFNLKETFQNGLNAQQSGDLFAAEEAYRHVLTYLPDHIPSLINLGVLLKNQGQTEAALVLYTRAFGQDQGNIHILSNLANALMWQGRFDEALAAHSHVLERQPDNADVHYNKGLVLRALGQLDEAVFSFDRALALKTPYPQAELDRAIALLMDGAYQEGLISWEARWQLSNMTRPDFGGIPAWQGGAVEGKTILLYAEHSIADNLLFLRYAQELYMQGAKIIVQCQDVLVPLVAMQPYIAACYPFGAQLPAFDLHAPLQSMGKIFGTLPDTVPNAAPYLMVNAVDLPFMDRPQSGFKIGIAWDAMQNLQFGPKVMPPLSAFYKLLRMPQTYFYSLQTGDKAPELYGSSLSGLVADCSEHIRNYKDLAQIIRQLDLIITTDNTVAHVACAMGKPTWVALPVVASWYWGYGVAQTAWYPTAHLFRQQHLSQWDDVFEQIASALPGVMPGQQGG